MEEETKSPGAGAEHKPLNLGVRDPKSDQQNGLNPPGSNAQELAPKHGGLRAGRRRLDGLIPGSPEALEADRKKDRERKARRRLDPAPLPSSRNGRPGPAALEIVSPQAGPMASVPLDPPSSFIPWDPKALEPLFAQLIPAAESLDVRSLVERAEKAKLPQDLVRRIEVDGRWNPLSKKGLELSCPQLAAKWLNYFGISSENSPEIATAIAACAILAARTMLIRRIDKAAAAIAAGQAQAQAQAAAAASSQQKP